MIAYTYNKAARQYVGPSGRFVPRTEIRAALDAVIDVAQAELRATALKLQSGEMDLNSWYYESLRQIKRIILASGTLAVGGPHALSPKVLGSIGADVKRQLAYLASFARELENGLPLDGRFLARIASYGESGRATYESITRKADIAAGMKWERRVLGASDHTCPACKAEAAKGWQPAGTLAAIGSLTCLGNCHCRMERSKSKPSGVAAMSADLPSTIIAPPTEWETFLAASRIVGFKGGGKSKAKGGKGSGGSGSGSGSSASSGKSKLSGGSWVTISGHPVYVKGGKVIAGGIPGVTHSAKGRKPAAKSISIDKADVPLARAFVRKQRSAARIRKNAPGKDTSKVDHAAMAKNVKEQAAAKSKLQGDSKPYDWKYEHGGPKSPADREHLRRAEAKGGSAMKVTDTPKVDIERGRNSTGYMVGGHSVARVSHAKLPPQDGDPGGYKVRFNEHNVEFHRTLKGAHGSARRVAAKSAKEGTTVKRFVVGKRAEFDPYLDGSTSVSSTTTFRTIHAGRGGAVGFAADEAGPIPPDGQPGDPGPCDRGCVCGDAAKADEMAKRSKTGGATTTPGIIHDVALFSLGSPSGDAGDTITYKDTLLFVPGDYPSHSFSMSEDELAEAVAGFTDPVPNEIEHVNSAKTATILDGKLGHVSAVHLADGPKGKELRGTVVIPKWLDGVWDSASRQVSCAWDRSTKRLERLGLVVNGHIPGAELVAAFSAAHPTQAAALFAGDQTWQGLSLLQSIHDTAAAGGATCDPDRSDGETARFHSAPELAAIQKVHDVACEGGAHCRFLNKSGRPIAAFATPRKRSEVADRHMQMVHDVLSMGFPDLCGVGDGKSPAMFADSPKQSKALASIHKMTTEHGARCPGKVGSMSNFSRSTKMPELTIKQRILAALWFPTGEVPATFSETVPDKMAGNILDDVTKDGAAAAGDPVVEEAKPAAFSLVDDPAYKQLLKDNEALKAQLDANARDAETRRLNEVAAFCAAKATEVIAADKAPASDYADILAEFSEAADADHAARGTDRATVTFSAGDGTDATVTGTRVAKLEARYARRSPLGLLGHAMNGGELPKGAKLATAAFSAKSDEDPEAARREILSKSEAGRAVLAAEDSKKKGA